MNKGEKDIMYDVYINCCYMCLNFVIQFRKFKFYQYKIIEGYNIFGLIYEY